MVRAWRAMVAWGMSEGKCEYGRIGGDTFNRFVCSLELQPLISRVTVNMY